LLQRQEEYYDIPTSTLTPVQIRDKLASLYAETGISNEQIGAFRELLKLKSTPNGGVSVTDDLKYTSKSVSAGYHAVLMDRMHSQILPTERGSCLPFGIVGWNTCQRGLQLVGGSRVDAILDAEGFSLKGLRVKKHYVR
jgi:hypothetical protein